MLRHHSIAAPGFLCSSLLKIAQHFLPCQLASPAYHLGLDVNSQQICQHHLLDTSLPRSFSSFSTRPLTFFPSRFILNAVQKYFISCLSSAEHCPRVGSLCMQRSRFYMLGRYQQRSFCLSMLSQFVNPPCLFNHLFTLTLSFYFKNCKKFSTSISDTTGATCSSCAPLYNNKPWSAGNATSGNPCQPCQCNGHAKRSDCETHEFYIFWFLS